MVTRVQWTMDDFKEIYARYKGKCSVNSPYK